MAQNIFRLPSFERRSRVLAVASLVSLTLHGLFLAIMEPEPSLQNGKLQEDAGISIELAAAETIQPQQSDSAPKALAASKTELKAKTAMPRKTEAPKLEAASKRIARKKVNAPKKTNAAARQKAREGSSEKQIGSNFRTDAKMQPGQANETAPMLASNMPRPPYPVLARKRGQEGTVHVRCQVDASGNLVSTNVAKSSGFKLLDEAALKAVGKWKFKPGRKNGTNIAGSVIVPVQFKLQ